MRAPLVFVRPSTRSASFLLIFFISARIQTVVYSSSGGGGVEAWGSCHTAV